MRLVVPPDGRIDALDRCLWLTPPFDLGAVPTPHLPASHTNLYDLSLTNVLKDRTGLVFFTQIINASLHTKIYDDMTLYTRLLDDQLYATIQAVPGV